MKYFIVNIAENFQTNRSQRNVKLYEFLKAEALDVKILSSNFDHAKKEHITNNHKDQYLFNVPGYLEHISVMRVITSWVFSLKVFFHLLKQKQKCTILVSSIPSELPFCLFILKFFKKIDYCIDLRDVWPASYPSKRNLIFTAFSLYCNVLNYFGFSRSKHISIVNPHFLNFLPSSVSCKNSIIPLGYDKVRFYRNEEVIVGCRSGFVYVGNLNKSFDLRVFSKIQSQLGSFLIVGDGELRGEYESEFPSCSITGLVDPDIVTNILYKKKIGLLPISGQATLPNKVYDYYACGLDILTNSEKAAKQLAEKFEILGDNFYIKNEDIKRELMIDYSEVSMKLFNIMAL